MTVFRQAAARRGVVIAAIGPAKWKTGFQLIWQGSAYFWFFAATLAAAKGGPAARGATSPLFNGTVGAIMMTAAVVLDGVLVRRSICGASAASSRTAPFSDSRRRVTRASKSSRSATSSCSASPSTPTPRIWPASSRRSASRSCGGRPSATRRTQIADGGARSARPHRRRDHDGRARADVGRSHQAVHRRALRPRDAARRRASRLDGGALAVALRARRCRRPTGSRR